MTLTDSRAEKRERLRRNIRSVALKILENPESLVDGLIYGGLAYLGYDKLGALPLPVKLLWGPIGLKLASTSSDSSNFSLSIAGVNLPVNSQIVGLTMLASLGFASLPWQDLSATWRARSEQVGAGDSSLGLEDNPDRKAGFTDEQVFAVYPLMKVRYDDLMARSAGLEAQKDFGGWSQEEADKWLSDCQLWRSEMDALKEGMTA